MFDFDDILGDPEKLSDAEEFPIEGQGNVDAYVHVEDAKPASISKAVQGGGFSVYGWRFGQDLWHGPFLRVCAQTPWHGREHFGAICLGPAGPALSPVLLVLGGHDEERGLLNDVWRSDDEGYSWTLASNHESGRRDENGNLVLQKWIGRASFASTASWYVESGKVSGLIYVVGGRSQRRQMADVWVSSDLGRSFVRTCADAPFGPRTNPSLAACPGSPKKMLLSGGVIGWDLYQWACSSQQSDCWISEDAGEYWTQVCAPDATPRYLVSLHFLEAGTLIYFGGQSLVIQGNYTERKLWPDAHVGLIDWDQRKLKWIQVDTIYNGGGEKAQLLSNTVVSDRQGNALVIYGEAPPLWEPSGHGEEKLRLSDGTCLTQFQSQSTHTQPSMKARCLPPGINRMLHVSVAEPVPENEPEETKHLFLPAGGLSLILITSSHVWTTRGPPLGSARARDNSQSGFTPGPAPALRHQLNFATLVGHVLEARGFPLEVWWRIVTHIFDNRSLAVGGLWQHQAHQRTTTKSKEPKHRGEKVEHQAPCLASGGVMEQPCDVAPAELGTIECREPLSFVSESSAWTIGESALCFRQVWSAHQGKAVRHQLCIRLSLQAGAALFGVAPNMHGMTEVAFQVVSVERHLDWRLFPAGKRGQCHKSWGLLTESKPSEVSVSHGGEAGHGRYFRIVERHGTVLTLCVELTSSKHGDRPQAYVWYELRDTFVRATLSTGSPHQQYGQRQFIGSSSSLGADIRWRRNSMVTADKQPLDANPAAEGARACREPLCLVCSATDWETVNDKLKFEQVWSKNLGTLVRHQICVQLASPDYCPGEVLAWEAVFVSLTFQVVSCNKNWEWRIVPGQESADPGQAWGPRTILIPGVSTAVGASVRCDGQGHGCNFHIVERNATVVTICVELEILNAEETGSPPEITPRVWYEKCDTTVRFTGCDVKLAAREHIFMALALRGIEPLHEYTRVIKTRCPKWWRQWDKEEVRRQSLVCTSNPNNLGPPTQRSSRKLAETETIQHLEWCIRYLSEADNLAVLAECRRTSTEKFGLACTFPYIPPRAMTILGKMIQKLLERTRCTSMHEFLDSLSAVAWSFKVVECFEELMMLIEVGPEGKEPQLRRSRKELDKGVRELAGSNLLMSCMQTLPWIYSWGPEGDRIWAHGPTSSASQSQIDDGQHLAHDCPHDIGGSPKCFEPLPSTLLFDFDDLEA